MNIRDLVQSVATNRFYLDFKEPRDERVLEALSKVDRQQFIPSTENIFSIANPEDMDDLRKVLQDIHAEGRGHNSLSADILYTLYDRAHRVVASDRKLEINTRALAYYDMPLSIGYEQTCSEPSMVGFICDVLELSPGMRVLEIGTGCGYHAAVTSELLGEEGQVVSIECVPGLADVAWNNLRAHFGENLSQRITLLHGDGSVGVSEPGVFDRIYFTAAVQREKFNPAPFIPQLAPHGILLYPEHDGSLVREVYSSGMVEDTQFYEGVRFVPLHGKNGGID